MKLFELLKSVKEIINEEAYDRLRDAGKIPKKPFSLPGKNVKMKKQKCDGMGLAFTIKSDVDEKKDRAEVKAEARKLGLKHLGQNKWIFGTDPDECLDDKKKEDVREAVKNSKYFQ